MFFILALLLLPAHVQAASVIESGTCGTCSWEVNDEGLLRIFPSEGNNGTLEIDSSLQWPWYSHRNNIVSVLFENGISVNDTLCKIFADCSKLTSVEFGNLNTASATDMSRMFQNCVSLENIDLSGLNTENVTTMQSLFSGCINLKSAHLEGLNTGALKNLSLMFENCSSLETVQINHFNTSAVTGMAGVFKGCSSLKELDLSSWNSEQVELMGAMFSGCSSLEILDLTGFSVDNVTNMGQMFKDCSKLTVLDLKNWSFKRSPYMSEMFSGCSSLEVLDLGGMHVETAPNMYRIVNGDSSIKRLVISSGFINQTLTDRFQFPSDLYEIAHDEDDPVLYMQGTPVPSGNADLVTEEGKSAVYTLFQSIALDPNGGTGTIRKQNFIWGYEAKPLLAPDTVGFARDGWHFVGWNTKPDGSGIPFAENDELDYDLIEDLVHENNIDQLTLYAQWEEILMINSVTLSLEGRLAVNIYITAPRKAAKATLTFSGENEETVEFELIRDKEHFYNVKTGQYRLSYKNIAAKEMTCPVVLRVYGTDGDLMKLTHASQGPVPGDAYPFRVIDWANAIISMNNNVNSVNLAKSILNYGEAAQKYFRFHLDDPANPEGYFAAETNDIEPVSTLDGSIPDDAAALFGFTGMTLNLEGDTELRLYFSKKISAVNEEGASFTLLSQGRKKYISIPHIASVDLDQIHRITVSFNGKTRVFELAALSYANKAIAAGSNETLVYLMKSLYLYNKLAEIYFDKVD